MDDITEGDLSIKSRINNMLAKGFIPTEVIDNSLLMHLEVEVLHPTAKIASRAVSSESILSLMVDDISVLKQLQLSHIDANIELANLRLKLLSCNLSDLELSRELR